MNIKYLAFFSLLFVVSCNDSDQDNNIEVVISNGHLQCQDNAIPIATTKTYLTNAGVSVKGEACGVLTNVGVVTLCGASTGEVHIFTIAEGDVNNAGNLGFTEGSKIEGGYSEVDCGSL